MAVQGEWNESLYGCFDDCGICLFGWCCTPCLFGRNAEKIDNSNCCLMCCGYSILSSCYLCCLLHYSKRGALRQKYGLPEEPCGDFPVTCCCGPCGLCQEARFLQHRTTQPGIVMESVVPNTGAITHQPY